MKRLTDWLATLPSTNTRIAVTLLCVLGTSVRYWGWGAPSTGWEMWLIFLAGMSGLDVTQFVQKRKTQKEQKPPGGEAPAQ